MSSSEHPAPTVQNLTHLALASASTAGVASTSRPLGHPSSRPASAGVMTRAMRDGALVLRNRCLRRRATTTPHKWSHTTAGADLVQVLRCGKAGALLRILPRMAYTSPSDCRPEVRGKTVPPAEWLDPHRRTRVRFTAPERTVNLSTRARDLQTVSRSQSRSVHEESRTGRVCLRHSRLCRLCRLSPRWVTRVARGRCEPSELRLLGYRRGPS